MQQILHLLIGAHERYMFGEKQKLFENIRHLKEAEIEVR